MALKYLCEHCELDIKKTYKFSLKNGRQVSEDVDVSLKGNFVKYHLHENSTEVWVINDFNTVSN